MSAVTVFRSSDGTRWVRIYRTRASMIADRRRLALVGAHLEDVDAASAGSSGGTGEYRQYQLA